MLLDAPEDQAICLFAGLLANPDMPLSHKYRDDHPVHLPETFCNHKPEAASPQSLGSERPELQSLLFTINRESGLGFRIVVYYESIKRKLKTKYIWGVGVMIVYK